MQIDNPRQGAPDEPPTVWCGECEGEHFAPVCKCALCRGRGCSSCRRPRDEDDHPDAEFMREQHWEQMEKE